jgi:hypothetical protein
MLLAEIHGKRLEATRNSEDYLTSTVFGHLRYIAPSLFWNDLLTMARGLPNKEGLELSLGQCLAGSGCSPSVYSSLQTHFWKIHPSHGEPDLILIFSGAEVPPLILLIEVKLSSEKSGTGDNDQLARYLRILDDLDTVGIHVPVGAHRYLIYLTPQDSIVELMASADCLGDSQIQRNRLFRLQWQDVLEVAKLTKQHYQDPVSLILNDVVAFLRERGLEYFCGMGRLNGLPHFEGSQGGFYHAAHSGFNGLTFEANLEHFEIQKGEWL